MPKDDDLPADFAETISRLKLLDDESLWSVARYHLPAEAAIRMEGLHLKRQREELTDAEAQTLDGLVRQYERTMLIRAQAAAMLKERGHDISQLLTRI